MGLCYAKDELDLGRAPAHANRVTSTTQVIEIAPPTLVNAVYYVSVFNWDR